MTIGNESSNDTTKLLERGWRLAAMDYHQAQVEMGYHSAAQSFEECEGTICRYHAQQLRAALATSKETSDGSP